MINTVHDAIRATKVAIMQLPDKESSKYPGNYEHDLSYLNMVLSALQAQLDRERQPEPLPIEHLKQMSTEPLKHWVWIENLESPEDSGYMRTHADHTAGEVFCCGWPGYGWTFEYGDYGKTWLAYTHKPRQEP